MTGIRLKDLKQEPEFYRVHIVGKGSKDRELKVDKELIGEIKEIYKGKMYLFETSGGKPVLKEYITHRINAVSEKVIGKRISAHVLRHCWFTHMIQKFPSSSELKDISIYGGHSQVSTTVSIYLSLLAEQKKGMKHGTFTPWIKGNLPFTDRTAQNYMKFYRKKRILISGNTEPGSVLTITEARKRLIKHVFPKRRRGIRIPFTGGKRLLFKAWIE